MIKYQIDSTYDIYKLINILKKSEGDEIEFLFEESCNLYKNGANLLVLKKIAEEYNRTVNFEVENPEHKDFIELINSGNLEVAPSEIEVDSDIIPSKRFSRSNNNSSIFKMFSIPFLNFKGKKAEKTGASNSSSEILGMSNGKKNLIKGAIIAGVAFILLSTSAWAFVNYVPKATIKLNIDSELLVKLFEAKASTDITNVDLDNSLIPAISISVVESDTQTIPTTGKKSVGDKATGSLTFINKTDKDITIKKGVVVTLDEDSSGLKYVTTEEVKVPKSEEQEVIIDGETKTVDVFGEKDGKIEAELFGETYNKDSDKKFKVSGFKTDTLEAKSKGKIEGGTTEEVQVVSQEDLDQLKKALEEFMKAKVKESLGQKLVEDQVLSETSITYVVNKAEYNGKLDDEVKDLSMSMTVEGSALVYSKKDLDELVAEISKKSVPDTFNLTEINPEYEAVAVSDSTKAGLLNIQIKLRSYILPKIDIDKIKTDTAGMKIDQAQEYLKNVPNVKEIVIEVSPQLPEFLFRMPRRSENIEVEIIK